MATADNPSTIRKWIRADLVALGGYSAHKSPDTMAGEIPSERIIKLDANENPYGPSPRVKKALAEYRRWHVYPDADQGKLRQQLQEYTGIDADHIVAGDGSGELLDDILCLFLEPGDEVINCLPTFDLYRLRTLINGGRLVNIPRDENFAVDIKLLKTAISQKTKLIILSNPNNPSGNLTARKDILDLVDTGVPVLIDEAYYEFCGETMTLSVSHYKNLMVLRTFSKWAGIAGLRMGYGIFSPEIAGYLMKIKLPYNVTVAAMIAVQESLKDTEYLMGGVRAIIAERERLFNELKKLEWLKPFPSQANFVFCKIMKGNACELHKKLQDRGILVRYFNQPLVQNGIRISAGKPEHTDAVIKALQELEGELNG
ncbi:histidinol-phosphate transaminase [Chloroflexota bacterium]